MRLKPPIVRTAPRTASLRVALAVALALVSQRAGADVRARLYSGVALEPARRVRLGFEQQLVVGEGVLGPGQHRTQLELAYAPLSWLSLSLGERLHMSAPGDGLDLRVRAHFDASFSLRRGPVRLEYRARVQDTVGEKPRGYSHDLRLRNRLGLRVQLPAPVALRLHGAVELFSDPLEPVPLEALFEGLRVELGVSRRFGPLELGASYRLTASLFGNDLDHRVLAGLEWQWEALHEPRDPSRPRRRGPERRRPR